MDKPEDNIILFSGYAKLPTGITASEMYKVIGVVVLIDVEKEIITEADCTLATKLANRHISSALIGCTMKDGPDPLVRLVDQIYQGSAKKAIITALRIIYDKYRSYKDGMTPSALD
ncbi:DUF3870 domain-containing protein [Acetonema longum]|uniref:DUF3870 domain-containing protein n=1 Tax=Acetonema longum DSM 6540 TaxID=1009370 RepID=F7NPD5_9FIRM|nr:DUF3870 domain-containing protein [Acetonema longum]EGO62097.1 hypothetical protein ALO_19892 [Acetonema longum DSM 6540]